MTSLIDDDEMPYNGNAAAGNVSSLPEPIAEDAEIELANQVAIQEALDQNANQVAVQQALDKNIQDYQEAMRYQQQELAGGNFPQNFELDGQAGNPHVIGAYNMGAETSLKTYHKAIGADAYCCYCIEIHGGLKMIAFLNAALTLWYCAMPFVVLQVNVGHSDAGSDASLQLYKWLTFLTSLILLLPTAVICRWLASDDNRERRKQMHIAYLFILLWNILRQCWIIGGSWLILRTSVYWHIMKLEAENNNQKVNPIQEEKQNDEFVSIQILELFVLTLLYWYFWQVAQRFKHQWNRSSRYLPDHGDPHGQIPTERHLNTEQQQQDAPQRL